MKKIFFYITLTFFWAFASAAKPVSIVKEFDQGASDEQLGLLIPNKDQDGLTVGPNSLFVASSNIWIADTVNSRVVKYDPSTGKTSSVAVGMSGNDVFVDQDLVYVLESKQKSYLVKQFKSSGELKGCWTILKKDESVDPAYILFANEESIVINSIAQTISANLIPRDTACAPTSQSEISDFQSIFINGSAKNLFWQKSGETLRIELPTKAGTKELSFPSSKAIDTAEIDYWGQDDQGNTYIYEYQKNSARPAVLLSRLHRVSPNGILLATIDIDLKKMFGNESDLPTRYFAVSPNGTIYTLRIVGRKTQLLSFSF